MSKQKNNGMMKPDKWKRHFSSPRNCRLLL